VENKLQWTSVLTILTKDWPCAYFDRLVGFFLVFVCFVFQPKDEILSVASLSLAQFPTLTFPFRSLAWVYSSSWSAGVFSQQVRQGQRHCALQAVGCLSLSRKSFHSNTSDSLYTALILCLPTFYICSFSFAYILSLLCASQTHALSLSLSLSLFLSLISTPPGNN